MRFGSGGRLACLAVLVALLASCGQSSPTEPTDTVITETFEGTLQPGEMTEFRFTVQTAGTVSLVVINSFQPETSLQIGVGLAVGSLNGGTCALIAKNDNAVLGTVIAGNALVGDYCVQVYDSGNFGEFPVDYTVEAKHL
jgi:hypothetical protein